MKSIQLTTLQGDPIIINADNICYMVKLTTGKGTKVFFNGLQTCVTIMEDVDKAIEEILMQSVTENERRCDGHKQEGGCALLGKA
jgi:hypothetical protein